jgi:transcription-repair coupling factor (superfamily II helicase)
MTATPIPRSLAMAEIGLLDLSVLADAPAARIAPETTLAATDIAAVERAIAEEIGRGGQVFVVCPRIEDAEALSERLEAAHLLAHGRMDEAALEDAMLRFMSGGADVLLSTTIIESGIDNPRANTMIVMEAERFGLSQLHQLRGRIGRSDVAARMILMTDLDLLAARVEAAVEDVDLETEEGDAAAIRRLEAFAEMSELGAGFRIARTDRDARGFGAIDGPEQSGSLSALGIGLYRHVLKELDAGEDVAA